MGLRINTNVQALAAQRALSRNTLNQNKTLDKLSSGKRIVNSADDAAGLSISEKLEADVRSIRQARRNSQDGISMIQTAEGGMSEISNILIRMRELSIQAASDTIGDTERGFIDKEVVALRSEVDRITELTEFNGQKLLSGDEVLEFQVGIKNDPELDRMRYDVGMAKTDTDTLGISDVNTESKESAQENLASVDEALNVLNNNRSSLGALQNRLQNTVRNLQVYDENLSTSKSRIVDADIAVESSNLIKHNILTQAGISALAQANQNPKQALSLL